jgi:hypothetical protein
MKKIATLAWVIFGAALLMADDYLIKTVKVQPMESYPAQASVGNVTIAADPYDTNKKSLTAFDVKKLNSRGYFPLHVIIQNGSSDFLKIHTRNIILITSSGQHLYTTPATLLVDDIGKAGMTSKIPLIGSDGAPGMGKEGSALSDFSGKELTNRTVDPGSVSDGFLFFFTPDPKINPFQGSTLYIPKLETEGTGKGIGPFSIALEPALTKPKKK